MDYESWLREQIRTTTEKLEKRRRDSQKYREAARASDAAAHVLAGAKASLQGALKEFTSDSEQG